jgi:hypothetical protein
MGRRGSIAGIAVAAMLAALAAASPVRAHEPDGHRLPVGDGHLSKAPQKGWIWACHVDPEAGGAHRMGPWFNGDGTYDITRKAVVDGHVMWPHDFRIQRQGDSRVIAWNDLPDTPTGNFPIAPDDDAYRYDRNPNRIREQAMRIALPAAPQLAPQPSCAPGAVGVLLNGAVLFSALDAPGRDAVAHETQDACQGHPQEGGVYHHHNVPNCLLATDTGSGQSRLLGYAIDGFGIYGPRDGNGNMLSSADLDDCHGRISEVMWDGQKRVMYHYVATLDFPYTIGCLRGTWSRETVRVISGPPPSFRSGGPRGMGQGDLGGGTAPQGAGQQGPGPRGGHPDLAVAARKLGIGADTLRRALGPPPPDLAAAAQRLGISEQALRAALGVP